MKIVYPMQQGEGNTPREVASLEAFIDKLHGQHSGTYPLGRNRLWHGGVHLSEKGGWHSSGAVRTIADGEIVAYRLATQPAKATRSPEQGQNGQDIDLYTSPSFCLIRHRYETGDQHKNRLTFYSLYMHIACANAYHAEPERYVITGNRVSIYSAMAKLQLQAEDKLGFARQGAEIILMDTPSERRNLKNETHTYQLVRYTTPKTGEPPQFYIATQYIYGEQKIKPSWMMPPENKPLRYTIPNNTWLRQTPTHTTGSLGLAAKSEVIVFAEQQMIITHGGPTEFRKIQVFKAGTGTVKDSANQVMTNAHKGAVGWVAKSKIGAALAATSNMPIVFDTVVDCSQNSIIVQAGETIGHWGEHQIATLTAQGFHIDPDQKAIHFEVFIAEKSKQDRQALEDCIRNKAQATGGQNYLVLTKDKKVTTYRLTYHNNQPSYNSLATFGPLAAPLALNNADIITHGAQQFAKIREQAAAEGERAGEFVLLTGDAALINQHDWGKLGAMLIDGSHDPDGFLDKEDTEGKEGSTFFSTLYQQLVADKHGDHKLSSNNIKSALTDTNLTYTLRKLFIKHESEWIKRGDNWPRLKKELANQPNLYKYAMQVHNNMAWVEEAKNILGSTHLWFIHPAGLMELVKSNQKGALWVLGKTSERYESAGRGPGVVSSGKGDYGGISYGCYQLSSNMGVLQQYIQSSKYKQFFDGLTPASSQFNDIWKDIAFKHPQEFREDQHIFIKKTHYDIQINRLKSKGFIIDHSRAAIHDLIWSTSVQFGAKTNLILKVLNKINSKDITDRELIIAVQDYKRDNTETLFKSSPSWWNDLKKRAISEKESLLELESQSLEVDIK
ncbi:MAG: hypothetical protein ACRC53_02100 [Plesiomonas sp.]|uniref:VgrG-related protein n=1 Tax=Plesiomonas sp. TaxID=2486279 RepID=UPI003F3F71CC